MNAEQVRNEKIILGNVEQSMDKADLESVKRYLVQKDLFKKKDLEGFKAFKEIWDEMIRKKVFEHGDYSFIKDLFQDLRMSVYRAMVDDFEQQLKLTQVDDKVVTDISQDIDTKSKAYKYNVTISYVKSEARRYAEGLKRALRNECISVFLDIDERDANETASDCLMRGFESSAAVVCLVTPKYGQTQWTHRQIVFAEMLKKPIIPIKFTELWPPRHLQKLGEFKDLKPVMWTKVGEKFILPDDQSLTPKDKERDRERMSKIGVEVKSRVIEVNETLAKTKEKRPATLKKQDSGTNMVAVIAHTKQKQLVTQIKRWLEPTKVWATCQDLEEDKDIIDVRANRKSSASLNGRLQQCHELFGPRWTDEEGLRLLSLQEMADKAKAAIIIVSNDLLESSNLFEMVVYCHDMEYMIPIRHDECFISRQIHEMIKSRRMEDSRGDGCKDQLVTRIKRIMAKK